MYDRPDAVELLQAARHHLETTILPLTRDTHHKLYFQTLVALNIMKIVEREIDTRDDHFRAEWARLNMLTGNQPLLKDTKTARSVLKARNALLCDAIRHGDYDDSTALFEHLRALKNMRKHNNDRFWDD
ncbi:MAG: DUF6285 domain-containing protein [Aggregatilineales bacterium]